MVMEHTNHIHKDLDLWPKGSFYQIFVESIQNTIVFESWVRLLQLEIALNIHEFSIVWT
jgi:hypothetical protein